MSSSNMSKGDKLSKYPPNTSKKVEKTNKKFQEIQCKNMEMAKKIVENYESSSDEEQLDGDKIREKLYKNYSGGIDELKKSAAFLENVLQSGSAICLICIGSVKRADAVWSCKYCYCVFHLLCIKRWANDSIALLKGKGNEEQGYYNNLGAYIPKKIRAMKWCCPQCRCDYQPEERPTRYECFCGKEVDPVNQEWIVPHSCGEACEKPLQPECGHKCMILCHPGPCPPCAQSVIASCKCGKSPPKGLRCFQNTWTCGTKCSEILPCGKHKCDQICHASNECPPCGKTSLQKCVCGNEEAMKSCSQRVWHCKKVCNKKYSCGIHSCKKVCHDGPCGPCVLSLPRTCPCGKSKKTAPCDEPIDVCNETCHKLLSCGQHYCNQRCHKGECSLCLIITKKKCRCGMHEKELACWKAFSCEIKCKRMRDCGKHACNKKCCDGQCAPCDKVCGKPLSCRKHKCASICHDGPCYPCKLKSQVKCRCGSTSVTVPCGRERRARVVCMEICRITSKCHHQIKHKCHKGDCPPCNQKCGLENDVTKCGHICEARCHSAVRVPIKNLPNGNIFDYKHGNYEFQHLPHPKCEKKVMVTCVGGHEIAEWPCWNSKPTSCQRLCNRNLKCGNHKCSLVCHSVSDLNGKDQQEGCAPCPEGCQFVRPPGCTHPCKRSCHSAPCDPCSSVTRTPCHCGLTQLIFKCSEYNPADGNSSEILERQEKLKSCGSRCMKIYPCGHRCSSICHSGSCPNPENCRKKVKIYCECKRIKMEISCEKSRLGTASIPCDDNCQATREALEKSKQQEAAKQRQAEEERNRIELEQFEKRFGKRKPRERRAFTQQIKSNDNRTKFVIIGAVFLTVAMVLGFYWYQ